MQEINDELMIPCADCARKHISAAIAHYVHEVGSPHPILSSHVLLARAFINVIEASEGYSSHLPFAIGLMVMAEETAYDPDVRMRIRKLRLEVTERGKGFMPTTSQVSHLDEDGKPVDLIYSIGGVPVTMRERMIAHVEEAEREFPEIRTAVDRNQFYRDNMSEPELRQAEVNYRLAQLRWLDENVFGVKPVEKGDNEMATKKANPFAKKGAKAEPKAAKKAACKGGKCKGGCKK